MKILVINGVNINMLGVREKAIYGEKSYKDLVKFIKKSAKELNVKVKCYQSNVEGEIVNAIQRARGKVDGIIINAGAYTHTSIAILDALKTVEIKTVEVHLTNINEREEYRHHSYISEVAQTSIVGKGFEGYKEALEYFVTLC